MSKHSEGLLFSWESLRLKLLNKITNQSMMPMGIEQRWVGGLVGDRATEKGNMRKIQQCGHVSAEQSCGRAAGLWQDNKQWKDDAVLDLVLQSDISL